MIKAFNPEIKFIKSRIEYLIETDYFCRNEINKNLLDYIP